MPNFIDRRLNPRDKSPGNRQRFLRRARAQTKEAVNKAINDRNVSDIGDGGKISIPSRGIGEPRFRHDARGGRRERVLPGNKEFVPGDRIAKPPGGGGGGAGKKGSDHGEGEDDFSPLNEPEASIAMRRDEAVARRLPERELRLLHGPHDGGSAVKVMSYHHVRLTQIDGSGKYQRQRGAL